MFETFEWTLNYARDCRQLLLATIPILAISLLALVLANMFLSTGLFAGAISFTFLTIFTCSFVTGNSSYSFLGVLNEGNRYTFGRMLRCMYHFFMAVFIATNKPLHAGPKK